MVKSRLLNLPPNLHLQIFFLLDAIDVISIRQSCKTFSETSLRKEVWTTVLRNMCYQNTVFAPTFSIDDMSVSELEKAATAPARMLSRLENHQKSSHKTPLKPHRTRYFSPEDDEVNFDSVFLVPGGRFLVTGSLDGLKLWDLSSFSNENAPQIVMSWLFPLNTVFGIKPTAGREGLILAAGRESTDGDNLEIVIYEYSPSSPSAEERVCEIGADDDFSAYTLSTDYFIRIQEHILHVWNFRDDTAASWIMPDDTCEAVMLDGVDTIIAIGRRSLAGWKIPNLEKRSATSQGPYAVIPPLFVVAVDKVSGLLKKQISRSELRWKLFAEWYDTNDITRVYDIASKRPKDDRYTLETYQIHTPSSGIPGYRDEYKVSLKSTTEIPRSEDSKADPEMVISDHHICNGRTVKCWSNRGFLQVHVPAGPGLSWSFHGDIDTDISVAPGSSQTTSGLDEFSFDPVSGSLCHLVDDCSSLAVLDFISLQ
ncbi:hypothetical protein GALMADRAFT_241929 [Galerina marginata CBS 339.88]|uniref:F-box domain-containing protein n=1 Tax=Galerina marginata (strain CBS 339.88) TaxID=685588 RepID=A0A067TIV3_GALM3|nr:hypothetical protein GALMADRAFT_241929 [Galerina marginata CBS 339.88]